MEQVAVMQNIFYGRNISKIFDLKGSLRGRFTRQGNVEKEKKSGKKSKRYRRSQSDGTYDSDSYSSGDDDDDTVSTSSGGMERDDKVPTNSSEKGDKGKSATVPTLLDGDFLEFTSGRPLPLTDRAKAVFHMSILVSSLPSPFPDTVTALHISHCSLFSHRPPFQNDTLFLSIINVLDYSILVGIDEEKMELVVGIIDFMRQYDILKQMERVGKSLPMVVGSEAPTIIQPPLYKARFTNAMERYFMTVPSKWTSI